MKAVPVRGAYRILGIGDFRDRDNYRSIVRAQPVFCAPSRAADATSLSAPSEGLTLREIAS